MLRPRPRLLFRLDSSGIPQADQDLLDLLMQPRQHIHPHRDAGDELTVDGLRRGLAIFRRFDNDTE